MNIENFRRLVMYLLSANLKPAISVFTRGLPRCAGLIGVLCMPFKLVAQVNMLTGTGGSATGLTVINATGSGDKPWIDNDTAVKFGAATPNLTYNLVGGSSTASTATATSFPIAQYQNAQVGGTGVSYDGIVFRVRLGEYSVSNITSTPLTVQVGIGPTATSDKASFAVGITLAYSGSQMTGTVFVADGIGNNSARTDTWLSGGTSSAIWGKLTAVSTSSASESSSSFSTSYWSYQAISGDSSPFNSVGTENDAWLTFGVTFSNVTSNASTSSLTKSEMSAFNASSTTQYNVNIGTFQGSNSSTWTAVDSITNFSDALTLTVSATNPVPEPSTYLSIAGMILPAGFIAWRRRRSKRI